MARRLLWSLGLSMALIVLAPGAAFACGGLVAPGHAEVLRRATLGRFAAGEVVFRFGDPPGGIYGMVAGIVTMTTAPPSELPRLIHLGDPGTWTGEACFVTREPRRVEIRAFVDTVMMHLPLGAMDEMAATDPGVARHFARILVESIDTLRLGASGSSAAEWSHEALARTGASGSAGSSLQPLPAADPKAAERRAFMLRQGLARMPSGEP